MKFATASIFTALVGAVAAAKDKRTFAVLHFNGKQLTIGRADPIVNPGVPSTHCHHILGGSNFGLSSTGEQLMKSNCTNAKVKGDNSNYWFPSLYFNDPKTGDFESVELFYANVYYFFEPTNDDIQPFPVGLQMLAGDAMRRDPPNVKLMSNLDPSKGPVNPSKITCPRSDFNPPSWPANSNGLFAGVGDPNNKGEGIGFPDYNCNGYASPLRADVHFPSCYNPKAGLTDFKNNMVYPSDNNGKQDCPKGYIHVPHLFYESYWNTPKFADRWQQGAGKQPFVFANGDVTGYSSHADFMAAWDEKLLKHIIDTCDAGTSGMDKCPGLFYGVNDAECTIPSPVDEQSTGVMKKLPGNNLLSGWHHGNNPGNGTGTNPPASSGNPSSSNGGQPPATQSGKPPASSSPAGTQTQQPASSQPANTQSPGSQPTSVQPSGGDTCPIPQTKTVYVTRTVTGETPSSTSALTKPEINGFKYAGCFKDTKDRVLNGKIRPDVGIMTNEKCIDRCKKLGFSVAGTEYGGQCYCGNEIDGSEKLDNTECNILCEGEPKETCGGSWTLSVYSTTGEVSLKNSKARRHAQSHMHRRHNVVRHS